MKKNDINILQCYLCNLNPEGESAECIRIIPGEDEETGKYLLKLVKNANSSLRAKPASYNLESALEQLLPETQGDFSVFCDTVANEILEQMRENSNILPGCGVFLWLLMEEQNVLAFFKLNYQSGLMMEKSKLGLNQILLPTAGKKGTEFFLINMDMQRVKVSDISYIFHEDPEKPVNLLADRILKVSLQPSEQEMLDTIDTIMEENILNYQKDQAMETIMAYKNTIASEVAMSGRIHMDAVANAVFGEGSEAASQCKESLERKRIPRIPVLVSEGAERKLLKKHKIVLGNGIEISVPPELLQNQELFSYQESADGNVTIMIHASPVENSQEE